MTTKTSLAVLCGGRSQRLGTDKGLFQPLGDEPLVVRALRLWAERFAEALVVVRSVEQAEQYRTVLSRYIGTEEALWAKLRIVNDDDQSIWPSGPPRAAIAGVYTALTAAAYKNVVVIPVDQLGVRGLHLSPLLQEQDLGQPSAYRLDGGDILPFPSRWSKASLEPLAARIAAGAYGVRAAMAELEPRLVAAGDNAEELGLNGNTAGELRAYFGEPLFDPFKRRLHYLRLSLTEACNLSCQYCLPDGFPEWYRHKARLGDAALTALLTGFRQLGFRKVRFTGGEPTVHPHCLQSIRLARQLGYERIALTTNGLLMTDLDRWVEAGLTDLNISLDSLDPQIFAAMTKSPDVAKVIDLVEAATARALNVKVNTVLLRTVNGHAASVSALVDWALSLPMTLRFIELMDTGLNSAFAARERVLGSELVPLLEERGLAPCFTHALAPDLRGPASDFASPLHLGRIGLINPLSCNFCSKCNRLRITAKGRLKLCLFGDEDLPLDLSSPAAVALNVRQLIDRKPERHYLSEGQYGNVATFRTIGG